MFILQDLPQGLLKVCTLTEAQAESHICRAPIKEHNDCQFTMQGCLFSRCNSSTNPILH